MTTIDSKKIAELRRLEALAAGDCELIRYDHDGGEIVWQLRFGVGDDTIFFTESDLTGPKVRATATLIAAMYNALPGLLDAAKERDDALAMVGAFVTHTDAPTRQTVLGCYEQTRSRGVRTMTEMAIEQERLRVRLAKVEAAANEVVDRHRFGGLDPERETIVRYPEFLALVEALNPQDPGSRCTCTAACRDLQGRIISPMADCPVHCPEPGDDG